MALLSAPGLTFDGAEDFADDCTIRVTLPDDEVECVGGGRAEGAAAKPETGCVRSTAVRTRSEHLANNWGVR